mgnify:CR=1 FL=1
MAYLIVGLDIENRPIEYDPKERPLSPAEDAMLGRAIEPGMLLSEMTEFAVYTRSDIPGMDNLSDFSPALKDWDKENRWLRERLRKWQNEAIRQHGEDNDERIDFYLVGHNAMFDISQFHDLRSNTNPDSNFWHNNPNQSYLLTNNGRLYGGTYKIMNSARNQFGKKAVLWQIRDTNNVFTGKLEDQASAILGEHKKTYDIHDEGYVTQDARLTARLFEYQLVNYFDAMTSSSLSLKNFKSFAMNKLHITKESLTERLFYGTVEDTDIINYLDGVARPGYYGGLTGSPSHHYDALLYAPKYLNPDQVIVQFDFVSMYPSVATSDEAKFPKPTKPDAWDGGDTLEELRETFMEHEDEFRILQFSNLKFKFDDDVHSNVLSASQYANTKVFWEGQLDNKVFVEVDAKYFIENVREASWDSVTLFTHECDIEIQETLQDYFNMLGDEKLVSEGAKKAMVKLFMNGLTGKFGQNITTSEHFSFDEPVYRWEEDPYEIERYNVNYVANLTALARTRMMQFTNEMGLYKTLQLDTDSGKILISSQEELDHLYGLLRKYDEHATPSNKFHGLKLENVYATYKLINRKMHGGVQKAYGKKDPITYETTFEDMLNKPIKGVHFAHAGMSEEAFEGLGETDQEKFDKMDFGLKFKGLAKRRTPTGLTLIEVTKTVVPPQLDIEGNEAVMGDVIVDPGQASDQELMY